MTSISNRIERRTSLYETPPFRIVVAQPKLLLRPHDFDRNVALLSAHLPAPVHYRKGPLPDLGADLQARTVCRRRFVKRAKR